MAKAMVEVFCAGCGKFVENRAVDLPYYGPPNINGCCPKCFPPKVEPVVAPPETLVASKPAVTLAGAKPSPIVASHPVVVAPAVTRPVFHPLEEKKPDVHVSAPIHPAPEVDWEAE